MVLLLLALAISVFFIPSLGLKLNCGGSALPDGVLSDSLLYTVQSLGSVRYYTNPDGPPSVYSSYSWAENGQPLIYTLPTPETELYALTLKFAELNESRAFEGGRVFDVNVNGRPVRRNVDVWELSGRKMGGRFDIKLRGVKALGGMIIIVLRPIHGDPFISSIEIWPISSPTTTPPVKKQTVITPLQTNTITIPVISAESTLQHFIEGDGTCNQVVRPPSINFTRSSTSGFPVLAPNAQGALLGSGLSERLLVVLGGNQPTVFSHSLDLNATATWARLANEPSGSLDRAAQAAIGESIYLVGGELNGRMAARFDPSTGWNALPDLPISRTGGSLLAVHSRPGKRSLLHTGGRGRPPFYSWLLGEDERWHLAGPSIADLEGAGAVETCGRHLVLGGKIEGIASAKVHEWQPEVGNWSQNAPPSMPEPRVELTSSVLAYKCGVIVVGGDSSNTVIYWEAVSNVWHTIGKWPGNASSKVCGIDAHTIVCASNGKSVVENALYIGKLW